MTNVDTAALKPRELKLRALCAFHQAPVELGNGFEDGLKNCERLSDTAAFQALRRRRLNLKEIESELRVRHRTVDQVCGVLMEDVFERCVALEDGESFQSPLEVMVWAQSMLAAGLKHVLPDSEAADVKRVRDVLELAGRLAQFEGIYVTEPPDHRRVRDDVLAQVSGLSYQLIVVSQNVIRRFFRSDSPAFPRPVNLRLGKHRVSVLEELYQGPIWPFLKSLDDECQSEDGAYGVPVSVSLCWAPVHGMEQNE